MPIARSSSRLLPISLLLALACGPGIEPPQDETGSSSEGSEGLTTSPTSTTASSTTTASTDDTSDDTAGSVFIIGSDGGNCAVSGEEPWYCTRCDLWAQNCPNGEKCTAWANDGGSEWNATRCSPIAPDPGGPGDPCTMMASPTSGIDDCDLGLMCWGVDPETLEGTCVPHCQGWQSDPICDPGTSCIMANDGAVALCLPPCDPLVPDACSPDEACRAVDEDPACLPIVGIEPPWACSSSDCTLDEVCLAADQLEACMEHGCCTAWCDLTADDPDLPCAAVPAHACQPYYPPGEAPAGLEHLGVCRLPA